MGRAATSLLLAAERTSSPNEDRLTEVFATVVAANPELAEWLAKRAGTPPPATYESVEVDTQVWTGRGADHVDMQVQFWAAGRVALRVWSEHKTVTPFERTQATRYADAAERGPKTGLLGITAPRGAGPDDPRWEREDWQAVLDAAVGKLREKHGRAWRSAGAARDAPAAERLLYELVSYLEVRSEFRVMVPDPLQSLDVIAYQRVKSARALVKELFSAVHDEITLDVAYGPDRNSKMEYRWMRFSGASPLQPDTERAWPDLIVSVNDDWRPANQRTGEPAFGVGHTFQKRARQALPPELQDPSPELLEALGPLATLGEFDGHGRLYFTKYLAELVAFGPSLQDQARAVARWAEERLDQLDRLLPSTGPQPPAT